MKQKINDQIIHQNLTVIFIYYRRRRLLAVFYSVTIPE